MSTGLTWILFTEINSSASPSVENSIVFNDYNEAMSFADWFLRCYNDYWTPSFAVFVYTASPNQNGRWIWVANVGTQFVPFD